MRTRAEAIDDIFNRHGTQAIYVAATGFTSRAVGQHATPEHHVFYMQGSMGLAQLLVFCKLASSNSEARRLVEQGAVRLDDVRMTDSKAQVPVRKGLVIRSGKRGFARIA